MLRGNYLATADEKGRGKNPRRFSGRPAQDGHEVLRHQLERSIRPNLSDEGVGRDREKTRKIIFSQPGQTEVPGKGQLLRPSSGGGWAGAHSDSTCTAGIGGNEGRR